MTKKRVNLSIEDAVLTQARAYKLNLSRLLEEKINERLVEERRRKWLEENREAIDAYNRRVERDGPILQDLSRI